MSEATLSVWLCKPCWLYNSDEKHTACYHCKRQRTSNDPTQQLGISTPAIVELLTVLAKEAQKAKKAALEPISISKGVKPKDKLENDFYEAWQTYGTGHTVTRQLAVKSKRHFTPKRHSPKTYKIDFAFCDLSFCIEIQGGTHRNGRHNRGAGYAADRKRIRDLNFMGWTVWEYTTDDLQPNTIYDTILEVSEFINQLEKRSKAA